MDGEIFECTTHRVDGSYTDSRRPDHVEFTARLEDDLSRRDFTVNAIAASPKGGICDCFGGVDDIKNKIIRCVGQPEARFGEDALRILRALRFATVLDFEIEDGTFAAIKKLSHTLTHISAERKTAELFKILSCEHADRGIRLLFECGVMPFLLPDAREKMTDVCVLRGEPSHRLAALMWQTEARDLSLLRLSNAEKSHIKTLLSPIKFSETDEGARRLIAAAGELATEAATLQNMPKLAELAARQTELGAPTSLRQLALGGADILALGIPSRQVGEVQRFLLEQVLISPELNEAPRLISLVKEKFNA